MGVANKILNVCERLVFTFKRKKMIPIVKTLGEDKSLTGKVAFVTGGSGGIGYSISEALIQRGCKVIIAGTNEKKLQENCRRLGEDAQYITLDLSNISSFEMKLTDAIEKATDGKIDILINCAGVFSTGSFLSAKEKEFDKVFDINVKGTYFWSGYVANHMISKHVKGHILNVSSSSGIRPAKTPYQMSKWAINGLTKGMAAELIPYGIVVNGIAPGPTATSMLGITENSSIDNPNPAGRYVLPEEVASLAVFMVSDSGNMIVGDTFYITGGSGTISLDT